MENDKYIGELDIYKVYQSKKGYYYALNSETNKFVLSGDTYEEVFDDITELIKW